MCFLFERNHALLRCGNRMTCLENKEKKQIDAHSKVKIAWSMPSASFNAKVNWCEMCFFDNFLWHQLDEWTKLWVLITKNKLDENSTSQTSSEPTGHHFFVHHLNRTPRKTTSDSCLCNLKMPPTPNLEAQQTQTFFVIETRTLLFRC